MIFSGSKVIAEYDNGASPAPTPAAAEAAESAASLLHVSRRKSAMAGHACRAAQDASLRATFGDHYYDLPGHVNEMTRAEARYVSIVYTAWDSGYGAIRMGLALAGDKPAPGYDEPGLCWPRRRQGRRLEHA